MSKGASKYARSGGKFTGSHTTLTPLACQVADLANKLPEVKRISPGFIQSGLGSGKGVRSVKFSDENRGCVLLGVRENGTFQHVRLYVGNTEETRIALAKALADANIEIRSKKN